MHLYAKVHLSIACCLSVYLLQITVDTKRRRTDNSHKLQAALRDNTAVGCTRFVVSLPAADQHSGHVVGEVRILAQTD